MSIIIIIKCLLRVRHSAFGGNQYDRWFDKKQLLEYNNRKFKRLTSDWIEEEYDKFLNRKKNPLTVEEKYQSMYPGSNLKELNFLDSFVYKKYNE